MTRANSIGLRLGLLLLLATAGGAVSLRAQDPRDTLIAAALNEFQNIPRRIQLLVAGLNPSGARANAWPQGVQALAQTLIDDGQDSLARVWLRWAIRLSPDLQLDTTLYTPKTIDAYRAARDFVTRSRTPGDSVTTESWLWSTLGASDSSGRLQLLPAALASPLRVNVGGIGAIGPGESIRLAPGSYDVRAAATGYDSARVTREVLPGVTTVLDFRLRSPVAQVTPPPVRAVPPVAPPLATVAAKKKHFPWLLAGIGAGGVGVAIALLAGGKPQTTTGGITFFFPNP